MVETSIFWDSTGNRRFLCKAACPSRSIGRWALPLLGIMTTLLAGCGTMSSHQAIQTTRPSPPPLQTQPDTPSQETLKAELTIPEQPAVDYWTRRFTGDKRKSFQVQLDRARDYVLPCQEFFRQRGLPPELVYVALVESGFTPKARSHADAVGMFQFISSTGKRFRLEQNQWVDERCHPFKAARAAADYLSFLYDTFGSWPLALAAYNCGEKAVQNALDQSGLKTFWELAENKYLPSETRDYVPKVYATIRIAGNPKHYGFHYDPHTYTPKHETVSVPGGVKLSWLEKQTGLPESSLQNCNPELCKPVTPPTTSSYDLCVPIGTGDTVSAALASCPVPRDDFSEFLAEKHAAKPPAGKAVQEAKRTEPPAVAAHTVQRGDTWFSLARRYECPVDTLASLNGLKASPQSLRLGQTLKVPAKAALAAAASRQEPVKAAAALPKDKLVPAASRQTPPTPAPLGPMAKAQTIPAAPRQEIPVKKAPVAESKDRKAPAVVPVKPEPTAKKGGPTAASPAKTPRAASNPCVSYPVRSGDTLYSIAGRFRVSVDELCTNNKLRQDQKLVAGNVLNICNGDAAGGARVASKKNN